MLLVNVQMLPDKDYQNAIPKDYVINVKDVKMTSVVVQLAKRTEKDTATVFHFNTERFLETHPDAIEGELSYETDPTTKHVDLIASVNVTDPLATEILAPILGRMKHRTTVTASRKAAARKGRNKNQQTAAPENNEAEEQVTVPTAEE